MSSARAFAFATASGATDAWGPLAVACAKQIGTPQGPHLGFIYASDRFAGHLKEVTAVLRRITGITDWVGSVGIGVIGAEEIYDRPALTALAVPLSPDDYRLIPSITEPREMGAGDAPARQGGLTVLHADPRNEQVPEIVARIAEAGGSFVVGGLTAARGQHEQVAGAVAEGGVSGVWLSPAVAVQVGLSQGCTPIGPVRRVTGGAQNVAFEIDGRPALDVLKEDIGTALAQRLERIAGLIHVAFPVAGSDTGDYLVRNLVGIDPQRGWIAVGDMVEPGRAVRFVRRDREAAAQDLAHMLGQLKRRVGGAPRAGLYFSCVARGPNLFGPGSHERAMLRRELGDFPLVGMFCNGEISNARLYGYTAVLTLFT